MLEWTDDPTVMRHVLAQVKNTNIEYLRICEGTMVEEKHFSACTEVLQEMLQLVTRAKHLKFYLWSYARILSSSQPPSHAPQLRSLEISGVGKFEEGRVLSSIFDGVYPRLEEVSVGPAVAQRLARRLFRSTLTRLTITRGDHDEQYKLNTILAILRGLPLLEVFIYHHGTTFEELDPSETSAFLEKPEVSLLNLRSLSLDDYLVRSALLLLQLKFPSTTSVSIDGFGHHSSSWSVESSQSALKSIVNSLLHLEVIPSDRVVHSVSFRANDPQHLSPNTVECSLIYGMAQPPAQRNVAFYPPFTLF